jgi:hypothetical protein
MRSAAVPIILYLVPPKSPLLVLALLIALFLLLFYPIWVCFSEKHHWLRILAIIVLAVAVVGFGFYVWPSQEIASPSPLPVRPPMAETFTQWLVQCVAYARSLPPWFWNLISLAIGAFAVFAVGLVIIKRRRLIESLTPKVKILSPLDLGVVGWHRTVRGKVYPPESRVQVLVRPPDDCWHVQEVEVSGGLWTSNCQFGDKEKPGMSYKVVAVHGYSLRLKEYDDLPESLIRSNVITVNRNSDEDIIDCPDKQLHQTKIDDKSAIKDMVKVCFVRCETHIDVRDDERQFIDFRFNFLNLSLFQISIESVGGYITFTKAPYDETIQLEEKYLRLEKNTGALNRGFRSDGWFLIRQYLPDYQVRTVATGPKESTFYFHNLNIMITGEGFESVRLDAPAIVQKGIPWIATGEAEFVFAGIAEAEAKIRELEAEKASLQSRLDQLTLRPGDQGEKPEKK